MFKVNTMQSEEKVPELEMVVQLCNIGRIGDMVSRQTEGRNSNQRASGHLEKSGDLPEH